MVWIFSPEIPKEEWVGIEEGNVSHSCILKRKGNSVGNRVLILGFTTFFFFFFASPLFTFTSLNESFSISGLHFP